jgi:hypothetical protein
LRVQAIEIWNVTDLVVPMMVDAGLPGGGCRWCEDHSCFGRSFLDVCVGYLLRLQVFLC